MSFRDLEGGPKGHGFSQQAKKRDDDSSFERSIKANIQRMQDSIRSASEQLDRASRGMMSKRVGENLDEFLTKSRDLASETEQSFRDWTIHLASEPNERHRKKFSYEKLRRAFEEEVKNLKNVAKQVVDVQREQAEKAASPNGCAVNGKPAELRPMCEPEDDTHEESRGLLDEEVDSGSGVGDLAELQTRISRERESGIQRIQSQVSEVNQIFRDLATIVTDQGTQLESIESASEETSTHVAGAVSELKKTAERQRSSRERLCCLLGVGLLLLLMIIGPHIHLSSAQQEKVVSAIAVERRSPIYRADVGHADGIDAASSSEASRKDRESYFNHAEPTAEERREDENVGTGEAGQSWGFQSAADEAKQRKELKEKKSREEQ